MEGTMKDGIKVTCFDHGSFVKTPKVIHPIMRYAHHCLMYITALSASFGVRNTKLLLRPLLESLQRKLPGMFLSR